MQHISSLPPWMFKLEGTIQSFCGKDPDKPKSILLEVEQERIPIRLPRSLRLQLRRNLQPGDRVSCIGRSQLDLSTGIIKLEAYQLLSLPISSLSGKLSATPLQVTPCPATVPLLAEAPSTPRSPLPPRAKIMLCRKSGCQKRGGKQLVKALEKVLQEHHLQGQVPIEFSGCQKRCSTAPSLTIMPGKHRYDHLTPKRLSQIIQKHFGPHD